MAKQIAKLLKATIQDSSDLKQIAKQLAGKGRGGDSMLVHITPREAMMLKEAGGAGTINPDTGLMEFYDGSFRLSDFADFDTPNVRTGGYGSRAEVDMPRYVPPTNQGSLSANIPRAEYETSLRGMQDFGTTVRPTTPEPMDVRSQFGVYGARPGGVGFRASTAQRPIADAISLQQAQAAAPSAPVYPGAYTPVGEVQQALNREPTTAQRLRSTLTSPRMIENLAMGGLQVLPGIIASRNAARQGQRAREEMQAMAEPYRQRGQELLAQAQSGALSPAEQQQLQAMQARIAQGVAGRGGVGAEQAQVQLEAFRQQILQNKYDLGLKVSGIADSIATGAIKAGLEADQYVSELTGNYFSNAMQMAMMNMGQRPQGV
jgi:hypothetical protein